MATDDSNAPARLGVIILNWNGCKLLRQLLPIVTATTRGPLVEVVLADNGSSDDSVEYVASNFPEVRIIRLDQNYGFAEGYNRAIEQCDYKYVTLLNSDVETTPGWWRPILDFLEQNPDVGAVQPKIRDFYRRDHFEYAGAAGGYLDALGYPFCRGRLFDCVEQDTGQYDTAPIDVAWASGACLSMPTALYKQLGGLDPLFFAHMEEIDLCCRVWTAGYRVCAISDSVVYHMGGASLSKENPKKTYLNFRNNLLLLHKNLPKKIGTRRLFLRRLADTLAFGMFILKGDFPNARAILNAHSDFRKMRKKYPNHPKADTLSSLPGAKRYAVAARYLQRKRKLKP